MAAIHPPTPPPAQTLTPPPITWISQQETKAAVLRGPSTWQHLGINVRPMYRGHGWTRFLSWFRLISWRCSSSNHWSSLPSEVLQSPPSSSKCPPGNHQQSFSFLNRKNRYQKNNITEANHHFWIEMFTPTAQQETQFKSFCSLLNFTTTREQLLNSCLWKPL